MSSVMEMASEAAVLTAATTNYIPFGDMALLPSTVESQKTTIRQTAGTFSHISAHVTANATTTASTLRSRKNTANGNQSFSVGSAATGDFTDASNTDSINATDTANWQMVVGATSTLTISTLSVVFTPTTDSAKRLILNSSIAPATTDQFYTIAGGGSVNTAATEASVQLKMTSPATLKNMYINCVANSRTTTTTLRSRKNTANGNLVISIATTLTGEFQDTSNSDVLVVGDLVCYSSNGGAGTGSTSHRNLSTELTSTDKQSYWIAGRSDPTSGPQTANTTRFYAAGGFMGPDATEANQQIKILIPLTFSRMQMNFLTNTLNGAATIRFRKNAANGNQLISVSSGSTGYFQDNVNIDILAAGDQTTISCVTAAGGTSFTSGILSVTASSALNWLTEDYWWQRCGDSSGCL